MPGKWCYISWTDGPNDQGPVDPGYGNVGGGNYPTTGPIYGGGHPGHALPGGGHISTLPVFPFDPTIDPGYGKPEGGAERPDNSLPSPEHPSHQPIMPGTKLVVKWLCGVGLIGVPQPK